MAPDHAAFARTPAPPYVAVIFTSVRSDQDAPGYAAMADEMEALASRQPGYLGIESARREDGVGITVSYWATPDAARGWKLVARHRDAQRAGREAWYRAYRVRVAVVERDYGFDGAASAAETKAAPAE